MNDREWCFKAKGKFPNRGQVWNETYSQGAIILWNCSSEQLKDEFVRQFPSYDIDDEDEDLFYMSAAKMVHFEGIVIIAFKNRPTIELIAHECTHWMRHIFIDTISLPMTKGSDEAHAYFMGWAVKRIWDMSRKHK